MNTPQSDPSNTLVIGRSARMRAVFDFVKVIGGSDSTVLITGESGTGKEVMATLIHQTSRRKHHPFVAVSCALFSETLIESELFGHERGAFTGAIKDRPGPFRARAGRHHLPRRHRRRAARDAGEAAARHPEPDDRTARRHSCDSDQRPHPRRHQAGSQADGGGRQVPRGPLLPPERPAADAAAAPRTPRRHPGADGAFLGRFFRPKGEGMPEVTDAVRQAFMQYDWPGNVRELENACERIAQMCTCGAVRIGCVTASILFGASAQAAEAGRRRRSRPTTSRRRFRSTSRLRDLETSLITWALKASHGNKSRAAELLQIKRSTLGDRIKHCGLGGDKGGDNHTDDRHLETPAP